MYRRISLCVALFVLGYLLWLSPEFKQIAAGVAIFLLGMMLLEEGFKAFTGGVLERLLAASTSSLPRSLGFGVISTALVQSSSLVSVITISFLSAGLITLPAGIGVIFGANLGTTTGAWLIAGFGLKVKISAYAMPMIVFGVVLRFQSSSSLRGIGDVLAGMGFLFLGIDFMKEGFDSYRTAIDLSQFSVGGYAGLALFCLLGVVATVVMQSSHATMVLILTALAAQQITYDNALALAIGANIGTTITAIIGSLSASIQGKRLALAHLIFNLTTGIIAIAFLSPIRELVEWLSQIFGIAAQDYTLKLAVFHTVFNLVGVLVMIPFIPQLTVFLRRVLSESEREVVGPKYLNESIAQLPDTLVPAVRNELKRLYDACFKVMAHGLNLPRHVIRSSDDLEDFLQRSHQLYEIDMDDAYTTHVKTIHAAIIDYATRSYHDMPESLRDELFHLRSASNDIVQVVKEIKHMRKNVVATTRLTDSAFRDQYNRLRFQVGMVMRLIEQLDAGDEDVDRFDLDEYELALQEWVEDADHSLSHAVASGQLTAIEFTSLMNDGNYAKHAVTRLARYARAVYRDPNEAHTEAETQMHVSKEARESLTT